MFENWTNGIDRICVATLERSVRVVAVVAPHAKAGVSSLAVGLADASHLSGRSTLLFDLSSGSASKGSFSVETDKRRFDRARIALDPKTRRMFSSTEHVRALLAGDLASYATIILDLPPVLDQTGQSINAAAAAAASDSVLLVALTGRTRRDDLAAARGLLDLAGASGAGVVMNDLAAPSVGAEIAREMARIERFVPTFARWGARKALASPLLNRV